jgi:[ribosomal protein S5]-alanine N-acetyltransferase
MQLRGRTVLLRYPRPDDAPELFELARDEEVTRWFSWGPYRSQDEPAAWIAEQEGKREGGRQLDFVIDVGGEVAGVTGLGEIGVRDRRCMVGTWLGRPFWGSGANGESKALVARLAFATCGFERIGAYSNPENTRSTAALERLGFQREGTLRRWHRHGDRQIDVHVYGLLREDWERGVLNGEPCTVVGTPPPAFVVAEPATRAEPPS